MKMLKHVSPALAIEASKCRRDQRLFDLRRMNGKVFTLKTVYALQVHFKS